MARPVLHVAVSVSLWLAIPGSAVGQATVEYGLGASRAATMGAPGKGIGKAMGGLGESLDKAGKSGQKAAGGETAPAKTAKPAAKTASAAKTTSTAPEAPATVSVAVPPPTWEDASAISTGLSYEELVRRFGPPALEISGGAGRSLSYSGKDGPYQLQVEDGVVKSVEKPRS